jgi:hypothetical protein
LEEEEVELNEYLPQQYHPDKNPSPEAEEKFKEIRYVVTFPLRPMSNWSAQQSLFSTFGLRE